MKTHKQIQSLVKESMYAHDYQTTTGKVAKVGGNIAGGVAGGAVGAMGGGAIGTLAGAGLGVLSGHLKTKKERAEISRLESLPNRTPEQDAQLKRLKSKVRGSKIKRGIAGGAIGGTAGTVIGGYRGMKKGSKVVGNAVGSTVDKANDKFNKYNKRKLDQENAAVVAKEKSEKTRKSNEKRKATREANKLKKVATPLFASPFRKPSK